MSAYIKLDRSNNLVWSISLGLVRNNAGEHERHRSRGSLSISPDPVEAWDKEGADYGIETLMLSDEGNEVATAYDVMKWGVGAEPGHTFVLVDDEGKIAWLRDYGDPENGGLMYVDPAELVGELERHLA